MATDAEKSYLPYRPYLRAYGRKLRRRATFPERLLWSRLRRRQLGVRFLRQRPIGPYIVDFYCPSCKLAIELDGSSHIGRHEADMRRQRALEQMGVRFLRFTNGELLRDLDGVVAQIGRWLEQNGCDEEGS
jgi:very-short-patch-repair endonuclease